MASAVAIEMTALAMPVVAGSNHERMQDQRPYAERLTACPRREPERAIAPVAMHFPMELKIGVPDLAKALGRHFAGRDER